MAQVQQLRRHLGTPDQVILGVTGAVGTGILFSSAGMAAVAGPGVILAWIIGAVFYTFIGLTYAELALAYPEAGGPSRYSLYSHGRMANLLNAFSDLIWYIFIPPIEALATVEGANTFYPHFVAASGAPTTAGAVAAAILTLFFLPFNYYGIKVFATSNRTLGLLKIAVYVIVGIGFLSFGHFANFSAYGGFAPFGMSGVFAAVPLAMFAFGGIRLIPDYAEETTTPQTLGRSIMWAILGQTLIYVLFSAAFVAALDWTKVGLRIGAWASAASLPGNPFLVIGSRSSVGWLVSLTVVIAIMGPFVTGYIYQGGGSRVLMAMGRTQLVSHRLKELNERYAIPVSSLIVFTVVGMVVAYIAAPLPNIYALISDAVVAGYIGFAINPVAMLAIRRQGRPGLFKNPGVVAALGFAGAALVVYWSGWPSVPYAVVLLALAAVVFGLVYRVSEFRSAIWYMAYILFLTGMTAIGSVGYKSYVSFDVGSIIVVVGSLAVFLPWGVASRLPETAEAIVPSALSARER